MADGSFRGGNALQKYLEALSKNLSKGTALKVGFLENATYPDGTSVAMVAAVNEFGGTIQIPEHTHDLNYSYNSKTGEAGFRFVKKAKTGFTQSVIIPAHKITVPARAFFRKMLSEKAPQWGVDLAAILKANDYNAEVSLQIMGERIKSQLQDSIRSFTDPANAQSTIKKKGFNAPLRDTGHMLNSVDFEVDK